MAFPAFSQDGSGLKPQGGDITAEVQLNLSSSNNNTISFPQFKGRYFLSPTSALRLGLGLGVNNQELANDVERNSSSYSIGLGIEKHLAGTERLSPYFGAEVFFDGASYDEKGPNFEVTDGWASGGGQASARAYSSYGLNVLAGADFYVARRLFLGVEFGFGFSSTEYDDVTVKVGNQSNTSEGYKSFGAGFNFLGGIRVGYAF